MPPSETHRLSSRIFWLFFCRLCTLLIPARLLFAFGICSAEAQIAWREKFALCCLISFLCSAVLMLLIGMTRALCPDQNVMSIKEFRSLPRSQPHCIIHGAIYDITDFLKSHNNGKALSSHIVSSAGKDVSYLFVLPSEAKMEPNKDPRSLLKRQESHYRHHVKALRTLWAKKPKAFVSFTPEEVTKFATKDQDLVVIKGSVYNLKGATKFNNLSKEARECLGQPLGNDKSACFGYAGASEDLIILSDYFVGVIDTRQSQACKLSSYILIGSSSLLVIMMLFKIVASLQFRRSKPPEEVERFVVIQVPCYSENEETLRRTIDSLTCLKFPDRNKLLFIVSDGIITGACNDRTTPQILLDIFNITDDLNSFDAACAYYSVSSGSSCINYAKVYSGIYECSGQKAPFVLVLKLGCKTEPSDRGNRGKRDSQMLLLRFLNKVYYKSPMTPLEVQIYTQIYAFIGIDPYLYEYIMMVDADTEVLSGSLCHLIGRCIQDTRIMGVCGETRLSNEKATIITMIQVYEYYIGHNLTKAFESLFGTVTCLPGCFCLYRLRSSPELGCLPLLIKSAVLEEYSKSNLKTLHEMNLLALGEDRYLTALMLRNFPQFTTRYTRYAVCKTQAPQTWSILLSQRRRWINSTIHNLFEIMSFGGACNSFARPLGFIVWIDLIGTLLMPASAIYLGYLLYQASANKVAPTISLILLFMLYGIQSVTFLLQGQWQYIGWLILYLISIPISSFIIPIYAYWHFDDFTWGDTRKIVEDKVTLVTNSCENLATTLPLYDPMINFQPTILVENLEHAAVSIIDDYLKFMNSNHVSRRQLREYAASLLGLVEHDCRDFLNTIIDKRIGRYSN